MNGPPGRRPGALAPHRVNERGRRNKEDHRHGALALAILVPSIASAVRPDKNNARKKAGLYLQYGRSRAPASSTNSSTRASPPAQATPTARRCCMSTGARQAMLKAKEYLDHDSFSNRGLIEQLEYEGFTVGQGHRRREPDGSRPAPIDRQRCGGGRASDRSRSTHSRVARRSEAAQESNLPSAGYGALPVSRPDRPPGRCCPTRNLGSSARATRASRARPGGSRCGMTASSRLCTPPGPAGPDADQLQFVGQFIGSWNIVWSALDAAGRTARSRRAVLRLGARWPRRAGRLDRPGSRRA